MRFSATVTVEFEAADRREAHRLAREWLITKARRGELSLKPIVEHHRPLPGQKELFDE